MALLVFFQYIGFTYRSAAPMVDDYVMTFQQSVASHASAADVVLPLVLPVFILHWIARMLVVRVDQAVVRYRNCRAFDVNSFLYNCYYTHLRALAP